jgi:hypothetical protein
MPVQAYVEVGSKRLFAGALDWPGWCRSARLEEDALEALLTYGPRYEGVLKGSGVRFTPPSKASAFEVEERLKGDARSIDRAADIVGGPLEKGPRGGGRELDAIVAHVVGAEASYARMIGGKPPPFEEPQAADARDEERAAVLDALERALADGIPEKGPRGGKRWSAPYFVRRAAWHVLDHTWEIEDRSAIG